jgi:hypothetical protein
MDTGQRLPWRPIAFVVAGTVAVVVLGLVLTARLGDHEDNRHRPAGQGPASTSASAPVRPVDTGTHLEFSFNDGLAPAGLAVRSAQSGQVNLVTHDTGSAVRFPPVCPNYGAPECPRAVLEAPAGVPARAT